MCGSIVSQIRMLHRESVSRATDRPSCSFLSDLFLAWISGSLNTLTFWWQWCRSWKWSDLTRRKGISCHQKIQCNRPPWWPYDPPRLCFLRNHDYTSSSVCQSSISWYVACRLRFPLESGTYLFFCASEKPWNSVDFIIVILDMIQFFSCPGFIVSWMLFSHFATIFCMKHFSAIFEKIFCMKRAAIAEAKSCLRLPNLSHKYCSCKISQNLNILLRKELWKCQK